MSHSLTTAFVSLKPIHFVRAMLLTASLTLSNSFTPAFGQSVGKTAFDQAPRLVGASASNLAAFVSGGTYAFTLSVPQDAGAPLAAVTISQTAKARPIEFAVNQSRVIANGATVPLASIGGESSKDVTIVFERPIQPGATVTIALKADGNSNRDGVHFFGVTAYPADNQADGLFLGYGRITLYSNSN